MVMIQAIAMLVLGFVFLVKGADFFVEGSSAVARKLNVPSLIIGLTIVAMGTSLPELSVSVAASIHGNNSLSVSNVVGSNMFNIMVILGASALITTIRVTDEALNRDFPFYLACIALLLGLGVAGNRLSRIDGAIFLVAFAFFLGIMVYSAIHSDPNAGEEVKLLPVWLCLIFIVGGAVAIKLGGDWVVDSAVVIARFFGVSETLIGLTIVALGTSLPEFVTSLVATKKGEVDMAIGNVLGSNIFNILLILGVASSLSPIPFIRENVVDISVMAVFSFLVWIFCRTKKEINRLEGAIMLCAYLGYLAYIIIR